MFCSGQRCLCCIVSCLSISWRSFRSDLMGPLGVGGGTCSGIAASLATRERSVPQRESDEVVFPNGCFPSVLDRERTVRRASERVMGFCLKPLSWRKLMNSPFLAAKLLSGSVSCFTCDPRWETMLPVSSSSFPFTIGTFNSRSFRRRAFSVRVFRRLMQFPLLARSGGTGIPLR